MKQSCKLFALALLNLNKEYHYTLYYNDMAGNLVKTVPPKGVRPDFSTTFINSVRTARANGSTVRRLHTMITDYRYNSLNQVIKQNTPDAGISSFWYDKLGRLAVSQNAKQELVNKYSYTLYDQLGRIVEVGQKPHTTAMSQATSQDEIALRVGSRQLVECANRLQKQDMILLMHMILTFLR
ncbi:MAG: hypothetical protein J7497_04165 [Chitinophagaceae bacterium]|nr:hypothetical protein [Chitinophagaceae bacterium]